MKKYYLKTITCFLFTALALFVSTPGWALYLVDDLDIDFTDSAWHGAYGHSSWTVDGVTVYALDQNEINNKQLYHDTTDGIGILGGEPDEINYQEFLYVDFNDLLLITGLYITDLFNNSSDGGPPGTGEWGYVEFGTYGESGTEIYEFFGLNSSGSNGEQYIDFSAESDGGVIAEWAKFYINSAYINNNDFSVAGFNATSATPEPATIVLLGTGIVGLFATRQRRKKK